MTRTFFLTCLASSLVFAACGDSGTDTEGSATNSTTNTTLTTTPTTDPTATETAGTMASGTDTGTDTEVTTDDTTAGTDPTDATDSDTETSETGVTDSDTTDTTMTTDPTMTSDSTTVDPTMGVPCEELDLVTAEPIPTYIVFVLDKSGSMFVNTWDHDNNGGTPQITRWNSLYNVVDNVLTQFEAQIDFGVQLFPNVSAQNVYQEGACQTNGMPEVATASNNKNSILAAIPGAMVVDSYGGTPAQRGVASARAHLNGKDPNSNRAIILVTDGAANCQMGANIPALFEAYDQTLHSTVAAAFNNDKIPTYVVGIDIQDVTSDNAQDGAPNNTNPYQKLNELANDGGVPNMMGMDNFYNSINQIELQAALDAIAEEAISCTVPLEPPPPEPDKVVVKVGGMEVPMIMDCNSENGWYYSMEFNEVTLCGTWCDDLKISGETDAEYYCTPG